MKVTKIALAILALAGIGSISSHAKNEPRTAYIFGFASSFNDSTVYFTSVQQIDSVYFTNKGRFLNNRENYSYQLRDYLEQTGAGNRTCIVIFDRSQKKAEKKWNKLYLRYTQKAKVKKKKNGMASDAAPAPYLVKPLSNSDFTFKAIQPTEEDEMEVKKAPKAKKPKKGEGPRPGGGPQPDGNPPGGGNPPAGGPRPQ